MKWGKRMRGLQQQGILSLATLVSSHTFRHNTMRATLLQLVDLRDSLRAKGMHRARLRAINDMVEQLMKVLRARGELCGCCSDCLDPALVAPEHDSDDEDFPAALNHAEREGSGAAGGGGGVKIA